MGHYIFNIKSSGSRVQTTHTVPAVMDPNNITTVLLVQKQCTRLYTLMDVAIHQVELLGQEIEKLETRRSRAQQAQQKRFSEALGIRIVIFEKVQDMFLDFVLMTQERIALITST